MALTAPAIGSDGEDAANNPGTAPVNPAPQKPAATASQPTRAPASSPARGKPKPPGEWIYRNLTPWRIEYRKDRDDAEPVLTVPPLGETRVSHADCHDWDTTSLRQLGQLELVPAPVDLLVRMPSIILVFGWSTILLATLVWGILEGADAVPLRTVAVTLLVVPAIALVTALVRELVHGRQFTSYRASWRSEGGPKSSTQGLSADEADGGEDGLATQVARGAFQALALVGCLLVAVVGPAVAIYLTSQLREVLPIDLAALFRFDDPFAGDTQAEASQAVWQLLIAHTAQWVLISVAAIVPAAMYFQFDRERLAAIQGRWVRQVFRLDPTVRSLGDIEAKYGASMEASFGVVGPCSSTRLRRGRRSPVVVATILITIGWIVMITGANVPDLVLRDGRYVWPDGRFPVASFFLPQGTALGFAFLGAYLFALFHVVRAYQRRDLVPKTYNTIVVRFLAAYVLTLAADAMFPGDALDNRAVIAFAFFAGFLPQSALIRLRELVTVTPGEKSRLRVLHERAPLTELEGIDLYDRTRLAEEGVNNVHALAHAELVELMSATRISADRLVDWTDQAILFMRVGGEGILGDDEEEDAQALSVTRANLRHLRRFGIRNASDLLQAYDGAIERGRQNAKAAGHDPTDDIAVRSYVQTEIDQLREALASGGMAGHTNGYLPIQGMLDTMPDEEWFTQIRNWRTSEFGSCDSWCWYIDGRHPYPRRATGLPERVCRFSKQQEPPVFPMPPARADAVE